MKGSVEMIRTGNDWDVTKRPRQLGLGIITPLAGGGTYKEHS
jgi:hypothetical protein